MLRAGRSIRAATWAGAALSAGAIPVVAAPAEQGPVREIVVFGPGARRLTDRISGQLSDLPLPVRFENASVAELGRLRQLHPRALLVWSSPGRLHMLVVTSGRRLKRHLDGAPGRGHTGDRRGDTGGRRVAGADPTPRGSGSSGSPAGADPTLPSDSASLEVAALMVRDTVLALRDAASRPPRPSPAKQRRQSSQAGAEGPGAASARAARRDARRREAPDAQPPAGDRAARGPRPEVRRRDATRAQRRPWRIVVGPALRVSVSGALASPLPSAGLQLGLRRGPWLLSIEGLAGVPLRRPAELLTVSLARHDVAASAGLRLLARGEWSLRLDGLLGLSAWRRSTLRQRKDIAPRAADTSFGPLAATRLLLSWRPAPGWALRTGPGVSWLPRVPRVVVATGSGPVTLTEPWHLQPELWLALALEPGVFFNGP